MIMDDNQDQGGAPAGDSQDSSIGDGSMGGGANDDQGSAPEPTAVPEPTHDAPAEGEGEAGNKAPNPAPAPEPELGSTAGGDGENNPAS